LVFVNPIVVVAKIFLDRLDVDKEHNEYDVEG
jgi:hypothetical protein